MKRYALAALALLLCCALSGCMGLQIVDKLNNLNQSGEELETEKEEIFLTPENTESDTEIDEPVETPERVDEMALNKELDQKTKEWSKIIDTDPSGYINALYQRENFYYHYLWGVEEKKDGSFEIIYQRALDDIRLLENAGENCNELYTNLSAVWKGRRAKLYYLEDTLDAYQNYLDEIIDELWEKGKNNCFSLEMHDLNYDGEPELIIHQSVQIEEKKEKYVVRMSIVQLVDDGYRLVSMPSNGEIITEQSQQFYGLSWLGNKNDATRSWIAFVSLDLPHEENGTFENKLEDKVDFDKVRQKRWIEIRSDETGNIFFGSVFGKNVAYKTDEQETVKKVQYVVEEEVVSAREFEVQFDKELGVNYLLRGVSQDDFCIFGNESDQVNGWRMNNSHRLTKEDTFSKVKKWIFYFENTEYTPSWSRVSIFTLEDAWDTLDLEKKKEQFGKLGAVNQFLYPSFMRDGELLNLFRANIGVNDEYEKYGHWDEKELYLYVYSEKDIINFLDDTFGEGEDLYGRTYEFDVKRAVNWSGNSNVQMKDGIIYDDFTGIEYGGLDDGWSSVFCKKTEAISGVRMRCVFQAFDWGNEMYPWEICIVMNWDGEKWILESSSREE